MLQAIHAVATHFGSSLALFEELAAAEEAHIAEIFRDKRAGAAG